ncbi:MAG: aspartate 1-decarboxylase [bacterium]|nr:aspartate 1-decarboxylase [bacterium]
MQRMVLKSKIHRAVVTDTCLHYEGSIGISADLLEAANILEGEQVHIYNLNNGNRFETYALREAPNSGRIILNGAAARLAAVGDIIIIATYALMTDAEYQSFKPIHLKVDHLNRIIREHR